MHDSKFDFPSCVNDVDDDNDDNEDRFSFM